MSRENRSQNRKHAAIAFAVILITNVFVIACSFILTFSFVDLNHEQIRSISLITLGNIVLLSGLILGIHLIINYFTVTKPARKIQRGLEEITNGDLSVRIDHSGISVIFDPIIDDINKMAEELSTVETLKTDFISNVSHEIKTPIAVMQNYSRLLQSDTITDSERKEYARTISDAAIRLNNLIMNILRLNRLENQQILPGTEQFDLGAQLTECLLGFESVWEEKNIEIEPEIEDRITVSGDRELLSIVWNNLLSNAFKFTEAGGKVGVTLKAEDRDAVVSIRDTGCGISSEAVRHIFDKFYQEDTSHATQGNGLGLALVKRIIDITGGSVSVSSIPGEGSTFTVRLKRIV